MSLYIVPGTSSWDRNERRRRRARRWTIRLAAALCGGFWH